MHEVNALMLPTFIFYISAGSL